jgi:hypothetical protein
MAYKGEGPLQDWLEGLFDFKQTITTCDTDQGASIKVRASGEDKKRLREPFSIRLTSADLEFAMEDSEGRIWPVMLRKAVEEMKKGIDRDAGNRQNLLRTAEGEQFPCKVKGLNENRRYKQKYLCVVAVLVTRLTNIEMKTSEVVDGKSDFLPVLTEGLKGDKPVIVFDKWAPRYLIDSIDPLSSSDDSKPDGKKSCTTELLSRYNEIKDELKETNWKNVPSAFKDFQLETGDCDITKLLPNFKVLKLDVQKEGSSKEIFYEFTGNGEEAHSLEMAEILRSRNEDATVRFLYPA